MIRNDFANRNSGIPYINDAHLDGFASSLCGCSCSTVHIYSEATNKEIEKGTVNKERQRNVVESGR